MPVSAPFASPFGSPFGPPFAHPLQGGGVTDVLIAAKAGADGVYRLQVKGKGTAEQPHTATIYQGPNHEGDYVDFTENEVLKKEGRTHQVAGRFNGVDEHVVCPSDIVTVADGFDIEFRYFHDNNRIDSNPRFVSQIPTGGTSTSWSVTTFAIGIIASGAEWKLRWGINGASYAYGTVLAEGLNTVRVHYDGSSTLKLYLNGDLKDTKTVSTSAVSTEPIVICAQRKTDGTTQYFGQGSIGDLVFKTHSGDITAQYEFKDGSGTNIEDSSGNSKDGSLTSSDTATFWTGRLRDPDRNVYNTDFDGVTLLNPPPSVVNLPLFTNRCKNGTQEAAQIATLVDTGKITLNVFGAGATATIAAGTAVGTGWGTANAGTPIELDITTAGTVTITATGPEAINLLENELKIGRLSGPIYSSGTEVATDAAQAVYDADNFDNDKGVLFAKIDPGEISQLCVEKAIAYGLGPELAINGRFSFLDGTGWSENRWSGNTDIVEYGNGYAQIIYTGTGGISVYKTINVTPGQQIHYTYRRKTTNMGVFYLKTDNGWIWKESTQEWVTSGGYTYFNNTEWVLTQGITGPIPSGATTLRIYFQRDGSAANLFLDDVSFRVFDANTNFSLIDIEGNYVALAGAAGLISIAVVPDGPNNEMHLYVNGSWSAATTYSDTLLDKAVMAMLAKGYFQILRTGKGGSVVQRKAWAERHAA